MPPCTPVRARRRPGWPALLAALAAATPAGLPAQRADTIASRRLSPGVEYRQFVDRAGPWRVNLVRVQLRRSELGVQVARAGNGLRGRERVTAMVRRADSAGVTVLAAVNADFFDLASGENENNQVIAGEWWKGEKVTDSPYDSYDNVHTQFALDAARRPLLDRFIFDGRAWTRSATVPIIALNRPPAGTFEGTALYTPRFGAVTPRDTGRRTVELPLASIGRRRDTLLYLVRGPVATTSASPIPPNGAVLAAFGPRAAALRAMVAGDTLRVLATTLPRAPDHAAPVLVVGGWPRLLRDGEDVAGDAATVEGTLSSNTDARHPRTAIGFSRDSATLYLVTVDGRSARSVGATLEELARLMRRIGAWQALNFDGGGSTTMVVDGALANVPSDSTGERAVGNALLIVRR